MFQFDCTNTIREQLLENVTVIMDLAEAVSGPPPRPALPSLALHGLALLSRQDCPTPGWPCRRGQRCRVALGSLSDKCVTRHLSLRGGKQIVLMVCSGLHHVSWGDAAWLAGLALQPAQLCLAHSCGPSNRHRICTLLAGLPVDQV